MNGQRGSLFERMKAGLEAGVEFARGNLALRSVERVAPPPAVSPGALVAMRQRQGLSQSALAEVFGVSVKTVQSWEQGTRSPSPVARRLFQIVLTEADAVARAVALKPARKRSRAAPA